MCFFLRLSDINTEMNVPKHEKKKKKNICKLTAFSQTKIVWLALYNFTAVSLSPFIFII